VDVPNPELAQQVAAALTRLGDATERSSWDVTGTLLGVLCHWEGHAARAAETLLCDVGATGAQTADAVHAAASSWSKLAGDLRSVETKIHWVDDIGKGGDVLAVASILQGGVDLFSDGAAASAVAEAETGRLAAKAMLEAAIERLIGDVTSKKAALLVLRSYAIGAVGSLTEGALQTGILDRFEYGHVGVSDVLTPSLAEALIPTPVSVYQDFVPTVHRPKPPGFASADDADLATTAAEEWAATNTSGALVSVGEGPAGAVRVTVRGTIPLLRKGQPYSAQQLAHLDPSLAAMLEEVGVWALAPVTVVVQ
jgi:hypothetical protein